MKFKKIFTITLVLATALVVVLGWNSTTAASRKIMYKLISNDNLYSSWTFEPANISGIYLTDLGSGNGTANNGVFYGSPVFIGGVRGQAMRLDGTDDAMQVGNFADDYPTPFSLSAWFKTKGTGASQMIIWYQFTNDVTARALFSIYLDASGCANFQMHQHLSGLYDLATDCTINLLNEEWHEMTATFDDSNLRLYVDGLLVNTDAKTYSIPNYGAGGANGLLIGASGSPTVGGTAATPTSNFFKGDLDEVKIYDRVLSATEIYSNYTALSPNKRGRISPSIMPTATVTPNFSHLGRFTSGLLRYYTFNGPDMTGSTSATDRGSAGVNATVSGAHTTPGIIGQALNFDGVDDSANFTTIGDPDSANISIEAWVRPITIGGTYSISGADEGNRIFSCRINSTGKAFLWVRHSDGATEAQALGTTSMTANNWYHVACTWDASAKTAKIYLNGVNETTATNAAITDTASSVTHMGVDSQSGAPFANYFKGDIDEFRAYNLVLTAAEVAEHYRAGRKDW